MKFKTVKNLINKTERTEIDNNGNIVIDGKYIIQTRIDTDGNIRMDYMVVTGTRWDNVKTMKELKTIIESPDIFIGVNECYGGIY